MGRPAQQARYGRAALGADLWAATTVLFLAVPQGLAYATIAGLPPAMGLYAAAIPTIVGSLFRSSRHVLSGPTNALSLLVGGTIAAGLGADPTTIALTLAFMVGVFQVAAGVLRLGTLVHYISSAVVLGYVVGAAALIAVGQLHNVTATVGPSGRVWERVAGWFPELVNAHGLSVAMALGTIATVLLARAVQRRRSTKVPGAIVALLLAIAVNAALGLEQRGVRVIGDLAPIPHGLPPWTMPRLDQLGLLLPAAIACAALSLVEANAVARSIASRTGQRIDASREFLGQGLSNLSAAFFGGYPVSGSLVRSNLNERAGGRTRMAGVLGGILMLGVLLTLGSVLDHTPLPSLAGLLMLIAFELVDVERIRRTIRASPADGVAFATTMLSTWAFTLDVAIYLGIAISLILFLRQARFLRAHELVVGDNGALQEHAMDAENPATGASQCDRIRFLHIEGTLFFGAAGELAQALDLSLAPPRIKVLVVRMKHTQGLDATSTAVFEATAERLRNSGRHLILVGLSSQMMAVLDRSGAADRLGRDNLFRAEHRWFIALNAARRRAIALCGDDCTRCPFATGLFAGEPAPPPGAPPPSA